MNAKDERVPTGADLEAKRKQWQAARDALTDEERRALDAELLKRQALNDIALDSPAVVTADGSWAAPSELLGRDPPEQPDYDEDDEVAQGYLALMRSKGIENPLPLWGQTLTTAQDGSVLWPGPDGRLYPLTKPGGDERNLEWARRKGHMINGVVSRCSDLG